LPVRLKVRCPDDSCFFSLGLQIWFNRLGLTSEIETMPSFPGGVPGAGTGLSSPREILGSSTKISFSSRMEGLNKSCANMPGWGGSQLDLTRARALVIVLAEDMVELEAVEFLLQLSYLLPVCSHAGVMIVRLSHDITDDELRVSTDVKPLTSALYSATFLVVRKCSQITQRSQSPLGEISTTPPPTPLRVKV
jgi:hypothetical protein